MRLRESGGTAVAVTDEELIAATREIGAAEGVFCAPEGAACLPALRKMLETDEVETRRGSRLIQHRRRREVSGSFSCLA